MIGEIVGGYRLQQKLSDGGSGDVYLAEHTSSAQKAAVKILFPQMCTDSTLISQFLDDVRAASLVNHSGIADVYECGVLADGRAFLVVEHLEGKTLTDALVELGQVTDVESLADIAWQLATILRAAHQARIIHAGLKPDAVFLTFPPEQTPRPRVKLLDFGMAKFKLGVRQSQTGSLLGAPLYMSPEIGRGLGVVDHRADIYSLGCIMFEMVCGRPPFVREGQGELIIAHASESAPFVSSFEPSIPPAVDQLIGRMLTKNPMTRPQSMDEVASVLEKFFRCPIPVADQPAQVPSPVFPQPSLAPPMAPQPALASTPASVPSPAAGPGMAGTPAGSDSPPQPELAVPATPEAPSGPTGVKTLVSGALVAAPASASPRAVDPTAILPPSREVPTVSDTALLPSDLPSSWLARVRQSTTMIEPRASRMASGRAMAPQRDERSRPSTKKRPVEGRSHAEPASRQARALESINLPAVVISAAILLVIAVVVLLVRREAGNPAQTASPTPALSNSEPSAQPRGEPNSAVPEVPTTEVAPSKLTIPTPSQPAARGPEGGSKTIPQTRRAGRDEPRPQKATVTEDPLARGKTRQPW
jgi:serine/threonine protein kinase